MPRSIQVCEFSASSLVMSTMLLRATTLPCFANNVRRVGLGAAARSGGLPAATRVVKSASWSRLASYVILMPVESVNGFITAKNEACSSPDQVAITFTDPALGVDPAQATVETMATNERSRLRLIQTECISNTPIDGWL